MPEPTPGQRAYEAFDAAYRADRFVRLTWDEQAPAVQRAWDAAAQAVLEREHAPLLYVVVLHEGGQIQLCGAYPSADEAGIHLAHARTIRPAQHYDVRVCPAWRRGQAHRQEDPDHA